jgi:hypothetical protein
MERIRLDVAFVGERAGNGIISRADEGGSVVVADALTADSFSRWSQHSVFDCDVDALGSKLGGDALAVSNPLRVRG